MNPVTQRALDPQRSAPQEPGVDRRTFVRRSAAVGVAVWTVPSVVSTSPVAAATGSCKSTSICEFGTGLEGWTIDNKFGPGRDGFWRHNAEASRDGGSLHYGRGSAGDYSRRSSRTSGAVTSPVFPLPSNGPNTIAFTVFREVETWQNDDFDILRLSVLGTTSQVLWSAGSDGGTGGVFETHNVTLPSIFDGQAVRFRFDFDTVDGLYNNFEGIYIGRVYVSVCPTVVLPDPPSGGPGNAYSPPGQGGEPDDFPPPNPAPRR